MAMDRYKIGTYLKNLRRLETYVWLGLVVVLTFIVTSFGWWLVFGRAISLQPATVGGVFEGQTPTPQPVETSLPSQAQQTSETYTVKRGDSLWKIAQAWFGDGNEYQHIMSKNNLISDELAVGQVLQKPTQQDLEKDHGYSEEIKESQPVTYTVKRGDSLWKIAVEHAGSGYKWTQLYQIPSNRKVIGNNPNLIYPGQQVTLPQQK
jgi:nucleoid-associated protein YgaU